jgi:sugar-specific transcriptional regulator TrmB
MIKALNEYGLTEKEAELYLVLLSLGNVKLQDISKKTDLPRSTIYNTLNYLSNKGLVSKIIKKGIIHFEAISPRKLLSDIERKKRVIEEALPKLEGLHNILSESSNVEIYEAIKKNLRIPLDINELKQGLIIFGSYSGWEKFLQYEPEQFRKLRVKEKIKAKLLIGNYDNEDFHKKPYTKLTEIKFNKIFDNFSCIFFIYADKLTILTLNENPVLILIKNKETSDTMKMIFEFFWKNSSSKSKNSLKEF